MPNKKRTGGSGKQTNVRVGNVSDISGNVNIAAGNITTHQTTTGLSAGELKQLFDQVYSAIENKPDTSPVDKEDLTADVKEIQATITQAAQKNGEVNEGVLSRRFRNIARMAPDVLEVIVATLVNPLGGLGVAVKKIAEKAKEETR
jgi:transposase-like protein